MTKRTLHPGTSAASDSAASGDVSTLLRAHDWSSSPLGVVEQWPAALRAVVSFCVNAPSPILICCQRDVVVCNDACRAALGDFDGGVFAERGDVLWPQHWETLAPIFSSVFASGEARQAENVQLLIERDGAREDCYFTFSCTPILDGTDVVAVLSLVTEHADSRALTSVSSARPLDRERAARLEAERAARAEAEMLLELSTVLNTERDIRALLQRVTDVATKAVGAGFGAFFYNATNANGETYSLYTLSGVPAEASAKFPMPRNTEVFSPTFRGEGVVRSADITQDPRYGKSEPHLGMAAGHLPVRSYLAAPVVSRSGVVLGGLFFGHAETGRFSAQHEKLLTGIAAQAAIAIDSAQLFDLARAQAQRWQASYEHAGVGIVEADLEGHFLNFNDKYCTLLGYERDELLGMKFQDVTHPDDVLLDEGMYRDLQAAKVNSYRLEKRYVRKDGRVIWVNLTTSLVRDVDGRPQRGVALAEDITERRRAETVIMGQKRALEQIARDEPLSVVLDTLAETFDRQSMLDGTSAIFVFDAASQALRPLTTGRLTADWLDALRQLRLSPGDCSEINSTALQSVQVEHLASTPRWESLRVDAQRAGFSTVWSVSICSPGRDVLGAFMVFYADTHQPSEEELRFLEIITDTAAVAISHDRASKSLRLQAQVLSHIHDAVIMTDRTGIITGWNEGAMNMFGYTAEQAIGQSVALCYFDEDRAVFEQQISAALLSTGRHELVARLRRQSGEALYGHVSLSLLRNERGGPSAVVAYVLDMTARVRAEEEINTRVHQQETMARIGHLALSGVSLQELMDQAVRMVATTLGVELCKILQLQPEQQKFILRAGVGWQNELLGQVVVSAGRESHAGYTLITGEPVIVTDLPSESRFTDTALLNEHGVVSGISVILQGEREPYGVLGAHAKRARPFSVHDINFMQSVADVLATAIQRKRVETMLEQAREDLERRVEERTAELARANQSLRDEIVDRMGIETALRDSEAQYRMLFERNPLPAWVFEIHTRQILAANETAVWQYGYTREEFLHMTIDALHPVEEMSRVLDYAEQFPPETAYIGVWKHRKQDETVIDVEMFVYEVLFQGRWARLVLANDITERRRAEQEFRLLEVITRAISEARDLDAALYAVLQQICEITGWAMGEAWLPGADGEQIVCSSAWYTNLPGLDAFRPTPGESTTVTQQGFIGRAWTARHPVWLSDVTVDEGFVRAARAQQVGLQAGTAFPVVAENEIVAVLAFFLPESRREDERLVKLVTTLAAQLGLAIQRKRAEEQLRRSELQLSEAQNLAHLGSWEWNTNDGTLKWSDELYRIYGLEPGVEMSYERYLAHVHPEDRERVNRSIQEVQRKRRALSQEERVLRADGEVRHLLSQLNVVTDSKGQVTRVVGVCLDITERKHAEQRLREYTHRLQSLSQRLLEAQETERRRIARELHDQIGQDLSVIKINLQALKRLPSEALTSQVDETIRVVEGVLATARNLSLELRPSMLDDLGLVAALRWYLDRQAQRAGFTVHLGAENVSGRLAPTIETACFRLAQEAVTNIMRHAEARRVNVEVRQSDDELQMRIEDDGRGFDVDAARARAARGESFGLLGMEERALLAGGRLEIISTLGQGTTYLVRFPLNTTSLLL